MNQEKLVKIRERLAGPISLSGVNEYLDAKALLAAYDAQREQTASLKTLLARALPMVQDGVAGGEVDSQVAGQWMKDLLPYCDE